MYWYIFVAFALAIQSGDCSVVPTPFGLRPKECVLQVPSGSHVEEDLHTNDLIISHPLYGAWRHTPAPVCSEQVYAPKPQRMYLHHEKKTIAKRLLARARNFLVIIGLITLDG